MLVQLDTFHGCQLVLEGRGPDDGKRREILSEVDEVVGRACAQVCPVALDGTDKVREAGQRGSHNAVHAARISCFEVHAQHTKNGAHDNLLKGGSRRSRRSRSRSRSRSRRSRRRRCMRGLGEQKNDSKNMCRRLHRGVGPLQFVSVDIPACLRAVLTWTSKHRQ